MEIYVCFGTNDKFKSWLIRKVTRSSMSHSWIEYTSSVWGGQWVAHTTDRGVIKEVRETVLARYPVYEIYKCDADLKEGLDSVRKYVGRADYDYGVIWNGVLLLVYRVVKWHWLFKLVSRNISKFTCSEFVALILKNAGLEGTETEGFDPELMTTGDVQAFVSSSPDFERVT